MKPLLDIEKMAEQQKAWNRGESLERVECEGVGDNDGFFEIGPSPRKPLHYWSYADTDDGAIVLTGKDANPQTGRDIIYMNDDHAAAKLIAKAPAMLEIVKAVAHIGVDFGYGAYELEDRHIENARAILAVDSE